MMYLHFYSFAGRVIIGVIILLASIMNHCEAANTDSTDCNYPKDNPTLDNAMIAILGANFYCAERELNEFLKNHTLDSKTLADAYVLLAHARYGMKYGAEDVADCFYRAYQADPGWYGELHFRDTTFMSILKTGRNRAVKYFGEDSKIILLAGGGLGFPVSPGFNNRWKRGIHALAGAGIRATRVLDIIAGFEYHRFDVEEYYPAHDSTFAATSGKLDAIMIGLTARLNLHMLNVKIGSGDSRSGPRMYMIFNIGGAITSTTDINLVGAEPVKSKESSYLYLGFGACMEFRVYRGARLFVQGRFVDISGGSDMLLFPISFGVRL